MKFSRSLGLLVSAALLGGCHHILDDFWLGKDNIPLPTPLQKFEPKLAVKQVAAKTVGGYAKGRGDLYKLSPVIRGNRIYTATSDGQVQALNLSDLSLVWRQRTNALLSGGPAVSSRYVALSGVKARVFVLDGSNGRLIWQKSLANQALAKPAIDGNSVYVKTVDGHFYAFNARSGEVKWRYKHAVPKVVLRADSSPVVVGNTVIAGFADGALIGFDKATGQMQWEKQVALNNASNDVERMVDIATTPIDDGRQLYVASYQGKVKALRAGSFRQAWSHRMSTFQNMTLGKQTLFVVDAEGVIWAFDKNSGTALWHQNELRYRNLTAPAYADGKLLVNDGLGYLHVLSAQNGKIIARVKPSSGILSPPVVSGKNIFELTEQGMLKVYKMS